mgnify:CR=1 FL=1
MSNVALPFLLKCDIVKNHSVSILRAFFDQSKFVTGSPKGELILWKINQDCIDPIVLMVPSLSQHAGMVTAIAMIEAPESDILVILAVTI